MKTKEASENRKIHGTIHPPLGYVSRRFSSRSRRYKKLARHDDVEEPSSFFSKSQEENMRPRSSSSEDFDEFVINRCKGEQEGAQVNSVALDAEEEADTDKETLPVRCRRHAICEEMERNIWNDAGLSLRRYREILVTRRLLYEMHLL